MGDREGLFEPAQIQPAGIAAVFVDGAVQFFPQRVARRDAEIAADVGEDGTNRLTPDFCRDLVWGGQVRSVPDLKPAFRDIDLLLRTVRDVWFPRIG